MTTSQRIFLMGLWQKACKAQGWDHRDQAKRHALYAEVLGSPKRFADFTNSDFGRVKARLAMLADDIDGAIEDGRPELDEARRLDARIEEYIRCLGVYVEDPSAYVEAILRDRFSGKPLHELSAERPAPYRARNGFLVEPRSQLEQLMMTLARCINGKTGLRAKAGHSMHDMYVAASIPCHCKLCAAGPKETAQSEPDCDPFEMANPF